MSEFIRIDIRDKEIKSVKEFTYNSIIIRLKKTKYMNNWIIMSKEQLKEVNECLIKN